jgi:hypothetical protein
MPELVQIEKFLLEESLLVIVVRKDRRQRTGHERED